MDKLCVECKWSRGTGQFLECRAPRNADQPGYEYVNPAAVPPKVAPYCSWHRRAGWLDARLNGLCGNAARWWEPKL